MSITRTRRHSAAVVVILTVVAAAAALGGRPAGATTVGRSNRGRAVIVKPDSAVPLVSGGSQTPYAVLLPGGAQCRGDTAHRPWYHVSSYLVRKGTDPGSLNFRGIDPPAGGFGFIGDDDYYGARSTEKGSGRLRPLPNFVWSRLTPADLFATGVTTSTWEGGLACADYLGVVSEYWNVEVRFTADTRDPGGFTWAVAPAKPSPGTGTSLPAVGAVVAGGGALGCMVIRSRRRRPATELA